MKHTRREHLALLGAAAASALVPAVASADGHAVVHEVQMLNKDPDNSKERNVFGPAVLKVNVGDTVRFLPTDRGHNSEVDEDMMPAGGDMWKGGINEEVEVTFTVEGTYGYYCKPHRSIGMVGLILVGDASGNFEDAKGAKQRGKAKKRYKGYFEEAEAMMG